VSGTPPQLCPLVNELLVAVDWRMDLTLAGVMFRSFPAISAAIPLAFGQLIEVPDMVT